MVSEAATLMSPLLMNLGVKGYMRLGRYTPYRYHTFVDGVRGSDVPLYLGNAQMLRGFALAPLLPGAALTHTVSRWGEELTLAVNACREALPDPDVYLKAMQDAWQEMEDCLLPKETVAKVAVSKEAIGKETSTREAESDFPRAARA